MAQGKEELMIKLLFLYLQNGSFLSLIIILLLVSSPFLLKYIKAKTCYYMWLIVIIALLIPFHLPNEHTPYSINLSPLVTRISTFTHLPITSEAESSTSSTSSADSSHDSSTPDMSSADASYDSSASNINSVDASYDSSITSSDNSTASSGNNLNPAQTTLGDTAINHSSNLAHSVSTSSNISLSTLFIIIWLLGLLSSLAYIILTHYLFQLRAKKWYVPITQPEILDIIANLKEEYMISSRLQVLYCKILHTPLTIGLLKPTILLPYTTYESDELILLLSHEMMHYKRRDIWYKCLITAAQLLHWFNPLVYLMKKQIYFLCEVSCDESVLLQANEETRLQYGEMIIDVVRNQSINTPFLSSGFFIEKNKIKERLTHIMNQSFKHNGKLILVFIIVFICSINFAFGFSLNKHDPYLVRSVNHSNSNIPKDSQALSSNPSTPITIVSASASTKQILNNPSSVSKKVLEDTLTQYLEDTNDINMLIKLAPSISKKSINDLVKAYVSRTNDVNCLSPLVSYLNRPNLNTIASDYVSRTDEIAFLKDLATYMSQSALDDIVTEYLYRTGDADGCTFLLPYLSDNAAYEIKNYDEDDYYSSDEFDEYNTYNKDTFNDNLYNSNRNFTPNNFSNMPNSFSSRVSPEISNILTNPSSIDQSTLDKTLSKYIKDTNDIGVYFNLVPYISQNAIDQIIADYIDRRQDIGALFNVIDLVSTKTVDSIMVNYIKKTDDIGMCLSALPYLSQDAINKLIEYCESSHLKSMSSDVVRQLKNATGTTLKTPKTPKTPSSNNNQKNPNGTYYTINGVTYSANGLPQSKSSDAFFKILENPSAVSQSTLEKTAKSYVAETDDIGHLFNILDYISSDALDSIMLDYCKRTQNFGLVFNVLDTLSSDGVKKIADYIRSVDPKSDLPDMMINFKSNSN